MLAEEYNSGVNAPANRQNHSIVGQCEAPRKTDLEPDLTKAKTQKDRWKQVGLSNITILTVVVSEQLDLLSFLLALDVKNSPADKRIVVLKGTPNVRVKTIMSK